MVSIDANDKLWSLQSSSFPYQKDQDRSKLRNTLNKSTKLLFDEDSVTVEMSTEQAAKQLARSLLGV
jgi:outer membrane protein OmpA-like peptidoglycan-associated protein